MDKEKEKGLTALDVLVALGLALVLAALALNVKEALF